MTEDLRLSEVVAALSHALDITDGQPLGHAVRSCLIGMRLADELDVDPRLRGALYYGLLLKDAGCTSNAAKIAALYGADDIAAKRDVKLINHSRIGEALPYIVRNVGGPRSLLRVFAAGKDTARAMTQIRCERGADIARLLNLPEEAAAAIYAVDEHWDGKGHPQGRAGEEIPLLGRILCLAQTTEVFFTRHGRDAALATAAERSGTWFDPELVRTLERLRDDDAFWESLAAGDVAAVEPTELVLHADDDRLDRVAEAFAGVIDAKSPYTYRHSSRVAELTVGIAAGLGFDADELRELRRAALLHDIGKLGISNRILDKPGALTEEELDTVRLHPRLGEEILDRVERFRPLADMAGAHHERLDGSGYPRGRTAPDLTPAMRALAVADVFEALTAERPYRPALSVAEAFRILQDQAGSGLCAAAIDALQAHLRSPSGLEPAPLAVAV